MITLSQRKAILGYNNIRQNRKLTIQAMRDAGMQVPQRFATLYIISKNLVRPHDWAFTGLNTSILYATRSLNGHYLLGYLDEKPPVQDKVLSLSESEITIDMNVNNGTHVINYTTTPTDWTPEITLSGFDEILYETDESKKIIGFGYNDRNNYPTDLTITGTVNADDVSQQITVHVKAFGGTK